MNNNINIAEILKDCPKGMKLYSPIYGTVELLKVDSNSVYSINTVTSIGRPGQFTSNGRLYEKYPDTECLLFPSREMRDWTKFFKRGDVVRHKDSNMHAIFEGWANDDYTKFNTTINFFVPATSFGEKKVSNTDCFVKANNIERVMFIASIEHHYKGKYNPDTLQVESVKPKCPFKPFDKVLVRDNNGQKWAANFFSHYDESYLSKYYCTGLHYMQCIHYEGNEHLLGTTDNK